MLKWLWKMFVRYVIGYYVPPGARPTPPPPPPSPWAAAAGKIVLVQMPRKVSADDEVPVKYEQTQIEVYVHGLSEDGKLAYLVAKPNRHSLGLITNWYDSDDYARVVKGIIGPIPEADRIDMSRVLARQTFTPATTPTAPLTGARTGRTRRPQVQTVTPQRVPAPADTGPQLREIDLPPEPTTESTT